MSHDNPYRAPQTSFKKLEVSGEIQGIWRDGKKLVVHQQAKLPPICVKTNEPSHREIRRKYVWHHSAMYFAYMVNPLVYIVLAMIVRKRHDLAVPVSEKAARNRRRKIMIGWALALASIGLCIRSVAWLTEPNNGPNTGWGVIGLILAAILLITGGMFGLHAAAILIPKKMTETATWFAGAHSEYLKRFPVVPPKV